MERIKIDPRPGWKKKVESQGFHYHTNDEGLPCWDESAYYQFESSEIDEIEECTYWLNQYCLQAVEHIMEENLYEKMGVPSSHIEWIKQSWERDEHTIYGRFDLRFDGESPPKLLEYNADTPTTLLEAAVIQWHWFKESHEAYYDQFNSIHDRLIEIFKTIKLHHDGRFFFASLSENMEDFMTTNYLRDCAMQAGWDTEFINVEDIGWHEGRQQFTGLDERTIKNIFKLYPWEWMVHEQFGEKLLLNTANWWEPPWKMLLSTKAILPVLWDLFPSSPYLLPAFFEPMRDNYVKKPIHGREGSNIQMVMSDSAIYNTGGPYSDGPFIYQKAVPLPAFDSQYPVIGSWLVNGYACGIGIREDSTPITSNQSRFVPHLFTPV